MNEKYLQTARLGEGVIYTLAPGEWHAALITKQYTDTAVDLFVVPNDGGTYVLKKVEFDPMAEKPGSWSNRPKI